MGSLHEFSFFGQNWIKFLLGKIRKALVLHRFVIRCVSKLERVSDDDDWFLLEKSIKMRPLRSAEVLDLKFSNYLPHGC